MKYSKNLKIISYVLVDFFLIISSFSIALLLRYDFSIPSTYFNKDALSIAALLVFTKIPIFFFYKLYKISSRYTSIWDFIKIVKANTISFVIILILLGFFRGFIGLSRAVFIIDFILCTIFTGSLRLGIKIFFMNFLNIKKLKVVNNVPKRQMILIGAGRTGELISREIKKNKSESINLVGFFDDDLQLLGKQIHNIPVLGQVKDILKYTTKFDEALICCPNANVEEIKLIVDTCKKSNKTFKILPSISEIIDQKVSFTQFREVSILDLLGRDEVLLEEDKIAGLINGKRILVTGAGGSIGSELVRQCLRFDPAVLIILDNSELNLFEIDREIASFNSNALIKPLLTDIRDFSSISKVFEEYKPQIVFHAAAYKHVPIQEKFPEEAFRTNVYGTLNVIKSSNTHKVEKFVLVSTDKAVKPANVMGATKRLAEIIAQCYDNNNSKTKFMSVRFGNVLGSSGSVIPIFRSKLKRAVQ